MVIGAENQNGHQVVILPFQARVINNYAEGINIKPLFIPLCAHNSLHFLSIFQNL